MRTTVTLADDVATAVDRVRQERHLGFSAAVNDLIRAGLAEKSPQEPFVQRTFRMGMRVDVTNIGEVLDLLDDEARRR